jgi:hypothetical protein
MHQGTMSARRRTVVAVAVLAAAGCGDATDDRASPAPTTPTTIAAPTTASPVDTTTPAGPQDYQLFLLAPGDSCDEVVPVERTSTVEGAPAEAMAQLLAGPTSAEDDAGLRSWFSTATDGMLASVVVEDGVATISFDPALRTTIPNASSSCGSAGLLAQLDATATQFAGVDRAVYSFDGDVRAFYAWLQREPPR